MRIIGIILIVLGLLGFIFGGFSFTQTEDVIDFGPLEVEREETQTVPITPIASGAAVLAGIALVVVSSGKSKE